MRRVNIKMILADPKLRRELIIRTIIATQAREGIDTTWEQAQVAYDRVLSGKASLPDVLTGKKSRRRR